ncbi:MAG: gamma-glutamyltransferase [Spongiibacteraceae bacterium]|nr:gamma-glutamyltransferase [Spongiibacteraceae bacterium]
MRKLLLPSLCLLALCSLTINQHQPVAAPVNADIIPEAASGLGSIKHAVSTKNMAVTANPHATDAAQKILSWGGTAVDAAVAAQLVLGLVEPQSSGIGGGAFVLHWNNETKQLSSWDGRETAPAALDSRHFMQGDKAMGFFDAVIGGHSVGTPGVIALLEALHAKHGKLPWTSVFRPAISLARTGFTISPRLHELLVKMPKVAVNPEISAYFFEADGKTPKAVGTLLKNPAYADTLERIAKKGAEEFYSGRIAKNIVSAVEDDPNRPGKLRLSDLKQYSAKQREPVCGAFRQYRVCGMGPPSSGGIAVAALLGTLQHVASAKTPAADQTHLFAEASRLAFADRNHFIGDPDFVQVPTAGLVDEGYLRQRSSLIKTGSSMRKAPFGQPPGSKGLGYISARSPELPSTSHFSIVDEYGNIVSMTTSIETAFGSRIMVGGFLLNNQLTDFSFLPEGDNGLVANRVQGGKRPRSSMSPTIVFEGDQPRLVIGSPGGSRIIDYVARSIWDILENGVPVAQAIAAPHIIHMGRQLELEEGRARPELIKHLESLGHKVAVKPQTSGLHAIWISDQFLEGGADPRREGTIKGE